MRPGRRSPRRRLEFVGRHHGHLVLLAVTLLVLALNPASNGSQMGSSRCTWRSSTPKSCLMRSGRDSQRRSSPAHARREVSRQRSPNRRPATSAVGEAKKATAAAVATFSESTPSAIGMETVMSHAASAAALRPGPSAPRSRATPTGCPGPEIWEPAPRDLWWTPDRRQRHVVPRRRQQSRRPGAGGARPATT